MKKKQQNKQPKTKYELKNDRQTESVGYYMLESYTMLVVVLFAIFSFSTQN